MSVDPLEHTGLIGLAVRPFRRLSPADREDLSQHLFAVLIRAARCYRCELGFRFSTYAVRCLTGETRRFLGGLRRSRRLGRAAVVLFSEVGADFHLGKAPEFARVEDHAPGVLEAADRAAVIAAALSALTPRERDAVDRRYGLGGHEPHTLDGIAREWGVTKERARP